MTTREQWTSPPATPVLADGEAQVWLAPLDVPADRLASLRVVLNVEERALADRFLQPQHRVHSAAARGWLRTLLGGYLRVAPGEVRFQFNSFGKPALGGVLAGLDLKFNVSHSHGLALFAFARGRELGVDIEKVRPAFATVKIAERFFAPAEAARLREVPEASRCAAFFECWTRKEGYLKARGDGLSRRLSSFEVCFGPGNAPAILRSDDEPECAARWAVFDLCPEEDFAGALVIERPVTVVRRWRVE